MELTIDKGISATSTKTVLRMHHCREMAIPLRHVIVFT